MDFDKEIKFLTSGSSIAVAPHHDGTHLSIIYTHEGILKSTASEDEVCNHYCVYYGSSIEGRRQASRSLLEVKKRPPIIISEIHKQVAIQLPCFDTIGTVYVFDLRFRVEQHLSYSELVFSNGLRIQVKLTKSAIIYHKAKALDLRHTIERVI